MDKNTKVGPFLIVICLITVFQTGCCLTAPEIYLNHERIDSRYKTSDTIIEAGTNITMICKGTTKGQKVAWTILPHSKEEAHAPIHLLHAEKERINKYMQVSKEPFENNGIYISQLNIKNMLYKFVGFYYCHYQNSVFNDDNDNVTSNVYLYVNDPEHLTVLQEMDDENIDIFSVIVIDGQENVIPCRPTSPDVRVTVEINGMKSMSPIKPKTGFTIKAENSEICHCIFSKNNKSIDILIYINTEKYCNTFSNLEIRNGRRYYYEGEKLNLKCINDDNIQTQFKWITPNKLLVSNKRVFSNEKLTKEDSGNYTCEVKPMFPDQHSPSCVSNFTVPIEVLAKNQDILSFDSNPNIENKVDKIGENFKWIFRLSSLPYAKVTLKNQYDKEINVTEDTRYSITYNGATRRGTLKINSLTFNENGNYTLIANNSRRIKTFSFSIYVIGKPQVDTIERPSGKYHLINKPFRFVCKVTGNPLPKIQWKFTALGKNKYQEVSEIFTNEKVSSIKMKSELILNSNTSGFVKCHAKNDEGFDEREADYIVTDVEDGFDIVIVDKKIIRNGREVIIAKGENFSMVCAGTSVTNIRWLFNGMPLNISNSNLKNETYSTKLKLDINKANKSNDGQYTCMAATDPITKRKLTKNITIKVEDRRTPVITRTNLKRDILQNISQPLELYCMADGMPKPEITWYKDGLEFKPIKNKTIISENNELIKFQSNDVGDQGKYKCLASNSMGEVSMETTVKFNLPLDYPWLIYVIALLVIIIAVFLVFFIIKCRKERRLERELRRLGLETFVKGAVENINPDLGIDDQAELLPYDKKFEFPIECLKLGKRLGSGAFGVVMKGEAKNIVSGEEKTTVAVKMVRNNAVSANIKALASELKIMVHLGQHLNVVNLLGAVTKNIAKRELMVVVEYCHYGNLQNYLLRHRDNFIDQIDKETGNVDYNIGKEELSRSFSVSSDKSVSSPKLKYAALMFSNANRGSMEDYRYGSENQTCETQMTSMDPHGDAVDLITVSNNSTQPAWRSNYGGDYKENRWICTKDLIIWAFQVARGMDYLASRKILHGDLAARNILLAENNIVKICDFGLAKTVYKSGIYQKKGSGLLPIKWMAVESIRDRVFSTQSDIWSFGVVLWEFFSLAENPYPGLDIDETFSKRLENGYRMERPKFAPKKMHDIMMECWRIKPIERPSFETLTEELGGMLEDSIKQHYVGLNDPYLLMNTKSKEHQDYLAMVSPPTFEALASPNYRISESPPDGYLSMNSSTVFSPRADEGQVFNFNIPNRNLNSTEGTGQEMAPMLRQQSECETPLSSPNPVTTSLSNPSYHLLPNTSEANKISEQKKSDIIKSADNYVNMPEHKNNYKEQISSNKDPFTMCKNVKEVPYVNGNHVVFQNSVV